ncbi:putative short-chain dehydrogenase [Hypoxylon sp. NC1633]|nr:putative short-chain dehydrogenase [Hypoxylon sp. NC1633]
MPADTLSLAGKVAIITGSGRENGIGAGIATALARNGASVAIHYVSESSAARARATAQSIRDDFGVGAALVQADVSTPEGAKKIVAETLAQLGVDHIDILVNNAGVGIVKPLLDFTPEEIQYTFGPSVFGSFYMTQAAVSQGKMPRGGRVVNIGSVASKLGPAMMAFYGAAKAAQDSLTASWAGELGKSHGITFNTIAPGPVTTDIIAGFPGVVDQMVALQRGADHAATPKEIADAVLLLVSEQSRWITAQYISASAGIVGTI